MLGDSRTHANFSVDDLDVAKEFYIDKLGFKIVREHEGEFMMESAQGTRANIYYKADHTPWNATVFGIEVDDLDKALEQMRDAGIEPEKLDFTDDDGVARDEERGDAAWFKDPAGNWVCVGTYK